MDANKIISTFSQYLIEHVQSFEEVGNAFQLVSDDLSLAGITLERKELPDYVKKAIPEIDGDVVFCREGLFLTGDPAWDQSFRIIDQDMMEAVERASKVSPLDRPKGPLGIPLPGRPPVSLKELGPAMLAGKMPGFGMAAEKDELPTVTLNFHLFTLPGHEEFTEEEKDILKILLNFTMFFVGRLVAVSRLKKSQLTSYLTGLPNAGGYLPYIAKLLERGELTEYNSYYFNLKSFSLVNRRFGNDEANNIIKRYANALKAYADEGEMIGHLGGDNFVALIRKEKTSDFLKMIAEKGVLTYGEKNNFRTPLKIYATAGVLEIDETIRDVGPVMSMANNALVVAKNVLHKPYVFMSKELQEQSIRNKQISVRFADALRTGEFIVYYQSVVNTEDNTIAGAEVFSRWLYEGKLMEAKEYIHNLDTDDSICQLDYFVLEQVCKDINRLLEEGVKPVPVYVNFSLKHLDEPEVVKNILDLLEKYQTPKELVLIEMVETPDQGEHKRMDAFVRKAREYGIHLSIDDFGSGYSSMNLFREHSIDFLKIDKNFVKAGAETEIDRIMINNMVRLAGELSVTPIAEGIENKELYSFIRGIGCKYMQGYLFDRPMPIEAFVDKLRAGKGLVE